MSLNFRARITLREHDDHERQAATDQRGLSRFVSLPDGAEVVVDLGGRWMVDHRIADLLRAHSERLRVTVEGSPRAVETWHGFIVSGSVS